MHGENHQGTERQSLLSIQEKAASAAAQAKRESARQIFWEILRGTSSFGLRSLLVSAQYVGNAYIMSLLGPSAAAASGITTAGVALGIGTMSGFGAATGVELGKALAAKDRVAMSNIIKVGWLMSFGLGGVTAAGFLSTRAFLPLFLEDKVATAASDLFTTFSAVVPAELWIWNNGQIPFKVENNAWLPLVTTVCYRLPAVGLAYYFAVTLDKGPAGIGMGAAVSGWLNVALFQFWYSRKAYQDLNLYGKITDFKKYIRAFFKTGWPVALQRSSEWLNLFVIAQIIGAWSSEKLLAAQLPIALLVASGFMSQGSGQFSMMEVTQARKMMKKALADFAQSHEAVHLDKARALVDKNYKHFVISNCAGVAFNLLLATGVYLGRDTLVEAYAPDGTDPQTLALASTLLLLNSPGLPFDASRNITAGVLRGWDDLIFPTVLSLLLMTFIAVPFSSWAGKDLGENIFSLFVGRMIALVASDLVEVKRFFSHHRADVRLCDEAKGVHISEGRSASSCCFRLMQQSGKGSVEAAHDPL